MTDQQPHTPTIPTTEIVEKQFVFYESAFIKITPEVSRARFRVWLEEVEAAAEQRGEERAHAYLIEDYPAYASHEEIRAWIQARLDHVRDADQEGKDDNDQDI